jgi:CRP-like cAMP-binding protein
VYKKGDYVMKEGEDGDKFYLLIDGNLIAEKNGNKVF